MFTQAYTKCGVRIAQMKIVIKLISNWMWITIRVIVEVTVVNDIRGISKAINGNVGEIRD